MSDRPLHIVSVSLGSSTRDFVHTDTLLGRAVRVERRGTDGDRARAIALIRELDGQVDAIGLGGIDLYLVAGGRKFIIPEALALARAATKTPVVDGSGLKDTLERRSLHWLQDHGVIDFRGKRALVLSGVDRFGMAETLPALGAETIYGDLIFALDLPVPLKNLRTLTRVACTLLPVVLRVLPFEVLYPTGQKQQKTISKYQRFFDWAEIIGGDFHYARRRMPDRLDGKIFIVNTTTADDVALLRARGAAMLINTTWEMAGGRNPGTNVLEGLLVALAGKRPEAMTPQDYLTMLDQLGWEPRVLRLQETESRAIGGTL